MSMGTKILRARQKRRWSQEELAKRVKVTQSVISRLESGKETNPTKAVIVNLALALGMSTDYLLGLYEEVEERLSL